MPHRQTAPPRKDQRTVFAPSHYPANLFNCRFVRPNHWPGIEQGSPSLSDSIIEPACPEPILAVEAHCPAPHVANGSPVQDELARQTSTEEWRGFHPLPAHDMITRAGIRIKS